MQPMRVALDGAAIRGIDLAAQWLLMHWLFLTNAIVAVFLALPLLAPLLPAAGWDGPASAIYSFYSLVCHQMPSRSYFLFHYQVAFCQRNVAIIAALLLGGLTYASLRDRIRPLRWQLYLLMILPMAVDGFTQLFGWRESTWGLRTLTGGLFGLASAWVLYPAADRALLRQLAAVTLA